MVSTGPAQPSLVATVRGGQCSASAAHIRGPRACHSCGVQMCSSVLDRAGCWLLVAPCLVATVCLRAAAAKHQLTPMAARRSPTTPPRGRYCPRCYKAGEGEGESEGGGTESFTNRHTATVLRCSGDSYRGHLVTTARPFAHGRRGMRGGITAESGVQSNLCAATVPRHCRDSYRGGVRCPRHGNGGVSVLPTKQSGTIFRMGYFS